MMKIINYAVRSLIIIIGLFLLIIYRPSNPNIDMVFVRTMGAIMTLFGIYRIAIYYFEQKKYDFRIEEEDETNESDDIENKN